MENDDRTQRVSDQADLGIRRHLVEELDETSDHA